VQMGILNNPRAIRLSSRLEEACYNRAKRIVCVTKGIASRLLERGIPESKVALIPNGANTEIYTPQTPKAIRRQSIGLGTGDFVVVYTGLLGLIHGLETLLEAAKLLSSEPEIRFMLVGDGPRKKALTETAKKLGLTNVIFHDAVPENELAQFIGLADVGVHVQRRLEISKVTLPVKMFSYMACQKPVVLAVEGEAAELARSFEFGLVVAPEDAPALADAVLKLKADPALCGALGRNGRDLVLRQYSRQAQAKQLAELLEKNLNQSRTR